MEILTIVDSRTQKRPCPKCGSKNTGQSVKCDWCRDCGWKEYYE